MATFAILVGTAFAASASATDTTTAAPVCPLTVKVKRSVDYCAAKGLVPGTVYGCVAPRTQQQVTCSTPAPYVAPVATYIAPVQRAVHTVDRCPDGTAPDLDSRDGVYKCPPTAYQVAAPAPVVTQRVVQPAAPAPTYSAYNAPARQSSYANLGFKKMPGGRAPIMNGWSSDYRYGKTVDGVAGVANAAAIGYAGHQVGKGIGRSGSTTTNTVNNNGGEVAPPAVDGPQIGHTSQGTMPGLNNSGTLGAASNGASGVVDSLGEDAFLVGNGGYANATTAAVHIGPPPGQFNGVGSIMVPPPASNGPTLGQWTVGD